MIDIENLSRHEDYVIPDGYFEQLPNQVMNSIRKDRARKRNLAITSIAAVALLVICSTLVLNFKKDEAAVEKEIVIETSNEEGSLEDQMADYYSSELAQMDYYNY